MNETAKDLDIILRKYRDKEREALIPILQDIQETYGYLSREAVLQVGRYLGLAGSKIFGVSTFYNQFRFHPPGRFHIQICRGTACHVKGSAQILEALKRELRIEPGQTTRDGLFSLEIVACMGACGLAPAICVNGEVYARLNPKSAVKVLNEYRRKVRDQDVA